MTPLPTTEELLELADAVVTSGFDSRRRQLADVVDAARQRGIRPVLAEIVADDSAPRPVRERALGRLVMAIHAGSSTADLPVTTGAASAA